MYMRNIYRSFLLRNFVHFYSKRQYFTHSECITRSRTMCFHKSLKMPTRASSYVSSLPIVVNENNRLVNEFPSPKKILSRLLTEAYFIIKNPEIKPFIYEEEIWNAGKKVRLWKFSIHMKWPKDLHVEGIASRKQDAETHAYLYACQKMKEFGLLDKDNNPLLPGKECTFNIEDIKSSKSDLFNLFQKFISKYGRNLVPSPKFEKQKMKDIFGKEIYWKCQLYLEYPETKTFESLAENVKEAEGIAAAEALFWLEKSKGIITSNNRLVDYSKDEKEKLVKLHSAPYSICIPPQVQERMSLVLHRFKEMVEKKCLSLLENHSKEVDINSNINEIEKRNLITGEVYYELSEREKDIRSVQMFRKYIAHFEDPNVKEIQRITSSLPITAKKLEILKLINENQVVVLSGETGCGKTTQVPQYILDEYIGKSKGADCNIIVSQPRRISAISVAKRIASERGEEVGETVGYHVRLNKNLPKENGAVLFCSTGMLLRKFCFNPDLDGISHVIVDEVHERSFQIDLLLILLKRLLESNKKIKILIMSASFNTSIFSQYFNDCPVIHVPGNVYPVKEYYLDNLPSSLVGTNYHTKFDPILDVNLVANVINYVHNTQKSGAILCFLPGWNDILAVQNKLLEICEDPSLLKICCAHSRLPDQEQKLIFDPVPDGMRKIILATNVAETAITINDVVYVVDSGLHKGTTFDGEQGIASLGTQWITKANVRQRRGRAGRVQHGVCYHLFPQRILTDMKDYPKAEILRMPLESVILDCKLYYPDYKAEDFLSMAIQPPSRSSLEIGVQELQMSGVLDENENLTHLGKAIVKFATHPRLSIALIYASFLGCLDPVLTICAVLTLSKEPFLNTLEDSHIIKSIKKGFDNHLLSDHLAMTKIFDTWVELNKTSEGDNFVLENLLDEQNLHFVKDLKALFAASLFETGIIGSTDAYLDSDNVCNINRNHSPTIFSALTAAFYPNVMKVIEGDFSRGKINKDIVGYFLVKGLNKKHRGYIQRESVAYKESELPSPWLVYFKALHSEARRMLMTSSVSSVPGICLLLFGGQQLTVVNEENSHDSDNVILMLDNNKKLSFSCTKEEADLILLWREQLRTLFRTCIQTLKSPNNDVITFYSDEFLPVLTEIVSTPQVPFTKGQIYKFVNNELISEELI